MFLGESDVSHTVSNIHIVMTLCCDVDRLFVELSSGLFNAGYAVPPNDGVVMHDGDDCL